MAQTTLAAASKPAVPPPFAGVSDKALKGLATKLATERNWPKARKAVEKAAGDGSTRALVWHLVEHGLVSADSPTLFELLGRDCDTAAQATALAELLTRITRVDEDGYLYLEGWTSNLDGLVYRAYGLAPAAFLERMDRFPPFAKLGLDFVRGRRGESVSTESAEAIVDQLARYQTTDYGITGNSDLPFVREGVDVAHCLESAKDVETVARLFVRTDRWAEVIHRAVKRNNWGLLCCVDAPLIQMDLLDLVALLSARSSFSPFGDNTSAEEFVAKVMAIRTDTAEALAGAKATEGDAAEKVMEMLKLAAQTTVRK